MCHRWYLTLFILTRCAAHMAENTTSDTVTHPLCLMYAKLRQDILARPVAVNRIPPCVETNYKERYVLEIANLIVDIYKFDEINQVMTLQIYYGITWFHPGLSWDAVDYDNISSIWVPSTDIWIPRIEINMGLENSGTVAISGDLRLSSQGAIEFLQLDLISFSCGIDFSHYPFDIQTCSVGFYPHGPPQAEPILFNNNFSLHSMYNVAKEWTITNIMNQIVDFHELANPMIVKLPTHVITVQRQPRYYVINIIFPMALTSVMIPLVFVIPTQTGEKMSYLVTLFTSTAIFLNFISDVMPRSLLSMPYLAILLGEVLIEGFLAMLAALIVVNRHAQEEMVEKKNKNANLCDDKRILAKTKEATESILHKSLQNTLLKSRYCPLSKMLDRAFFLIFTIGQVIFLVVLLWGTDWMINSKKASE